MHLWQLHAQTPKTPHIRTHVWRFCRKWQTVFILRSCVSAVVVVRDLKGIWHDQTLAQDARTKLFHKTRHSRRATILSRTTCLKYGGAIHQKRRQSRAQKPTQVPIGMADVSGENAVNNTAQDMPAEQHGMPSKYAVNQTGLTPNRFAIQEETEKDLRKYGNTTDPDYAFLRTCTSVALTLK